MRALLFGTEKNGDMEHGDSAHFSVYYSQLWRLGVFCSWEVHTYTYLGWVLGHWKS
jgi:hypothetical protein